MRNLAILFLSVFFCSCGGVDYKYVKSKYWSYDEGFRVGKGDFMFFDKGNENFSINGDTIFYKSKPTAIIVDLNKKYFSLTLKSIETGELGRYRDESESLQR